MRKLQHQRRAFLKYSAAAAAGALAARLCPPPVFGQPAAGVPQFEMLVLGDSLLWGQGLNDADKFHTLVRKGLEDELLRRPVNQVVKAHSGATILPDKSRCVVAHGEVNLSRPTILYQIRMALDDYAARGVPPQSVGLVLTNGGINDATFPRLLNVFATSRKKVRELAREHCGRRMRGLLLETAAAFPNSLVVVPGYFPFVTKGTDPAVVKNLILAYLGLDRGRASLEAADEGRAGRRDRNWLVGRLAELSAEWEEASSESLQWAVDQVNAEIARRPELQLSAAARAANPLAARLKSSEGRRVFFVRVRFGDDEGYAAPKTLFWRITGSNPRHDVDPKASRLLTDDQQFQSRQIQCALPRLDPAHLMSCQVAGTGHPNVRGARRYADAILAALRELTSG